MFLNRRRSRFHDPWGNKRGNACGQVTGFQYLVSKSQLYTRSIDSRISWFDTDKDCGGGYDRFVRGSRVEALRR